jgi:DNA-directed RNA polymerase beta' subunit
MPSQVTTAGQLMIRGAVPVDMQDSTPVFDKKGVGSFFQELATKHPDHYIETLQKLNNISRSAMTYYGPEASVSLKDYALPPVIIKMRENIRQNITKLSQDPSLNSKQKNEAIVSYMRDNMDDIRKQLVTEGVKNNNAFAKAVQLGIRGDETQLGQLLFGDLLVADSMGRPVPYPGTHSYAEGTTPLEYFAGSYGSRKGYVDVQMSTSEAGYLGKQLAYSAHAVRVMAPDCGGKTSSVTRLGEDSEIVGSTLAYDVAGLKAGQSITKSDLPKLADKTVQVFSPLVCQLPEGVCQ